MNRKEQKVLVVGAGKSGIAAARALAEQGAAVTLCDQKPLEQWATSLDLAEKGVTLYGGGYPELARSGFAEVVLSPGVSILGSLAQEAAQLGIKVTGELELAFSLSHEPWIAITGTNGKTTTTSLVGAILAEAGWQPLVGGNIGQPLIEEVQLPGKYKSVVAEVSSFQLETVERFQPRVAMILNITPDHLDRHGTMENYRAMKARIFARQQPSDITVLNADDPLVASLASDCPGKVLLFSRLGEVAVGAFVREGWIVFRDDQGERPVVSIDELQIKGAHNVENALAACAGSMALGVAADVVGRSMQAFQPVEHRMEPVATVDGVLYVNDSKGTNPDATIKAIESYRQPVVLIAGGKNKGSDFADLAQVVAQRVKWLVLVGQAADLIEAAVRATGFDRITRVATYPEAVKAAQAQATLGDVVLLSPACASMDMFRNYEERGQVFKQLVCSLPAGKVLAH
ncbi:UDP-N-acetylmuramoyl-L-alanine--D-glutamate ligase [Heliophilum fasciatum]|uniref:UDP-N-acetylmuramoylalanine--D-glutamate ligase n=1 Tax=Heliophilum fasciatum TaxID=35700 RepID=A0A4R2RH87_9FIRM|nr:UDP-N-acetylmuramoyl-L-alanine--D-glutamate ligase [Heliophilum fasciatum]MCW2278854.1 UDP-N-acetylmuramoylalanine--D-glutamate ligase [Heliophilum fasciatum]TCP62134.1 UDP-N-acetylmuramoylalanine--D-glutamate ligase [Heliophilum fasciatum]